MRRLESSSRASLPEASAPPSGRAPHIALAALVLAVTLPLLALAGCGRSRAPGGSGSLVRERGRPAVLSLAGSPYEMGWWHGHLLRPRILDRAAAARRLQPADFIEAMADQALVRISERLRQELDGMAAATGLSLMDLLRAEVATEALRYKGSEATKTGMAGLAPHEGGFEARMRYQGPGASHFAREALLIHRQPSGHPASIALGLPGSVGAWAYVTAQGRGYVLAEVEMGNRQRLGFGGGRPFEMAAREALDAAEDVEQFAAELTGSMGHTGLGFSYHPTELPAVRAMAGVQVYGAPDLPWALAELPFLAVGPFEDPAHPDAKALQAQVVKPPELSTDERWLRLMALAGASEGAAAPEWRVRTEGARVVVTWSAGTGEVSTEMPLLR